MTFNFSVLKGAVASLALAVPGTVSAADAPTPKACENRHADRAACAEAYTGGFRVECYQEGELVFEGQAYKAKAEAKAGNPLPYVQADGQPVAPLWEKYGACKMKRYDDAG